MSSTPEQSKRWRERYPEKVRAYRSTEEYRKRRAARRSGYWIRSREINTMLARIREVARSATS